MRVLILLFVLTISARADTTPNIIYLMTDEQRLDTFGVYGGEQYKTHHIDAMAKDGVVFDNAHYAVAICMPSRATAFTGRYLSSHRTGFVAPNNISLSYDDMNKSYPALLKQAGYRTGFIGKLGVPTTQTSAPHRAISRSNEGNYPIKKHYENYFDFFVGSSVHLGRGRANVEVWAEEEQGLAELFPPKKSSGGASKATNVGDVALRFLETNPQDKPFCLSISFYSVKGSALSEYSKLFDGVDFNRPPNWSEGANQALPEFIAKYWRGVGRHAKESSNIKKYNNTMKNIAGLGYEVDLQVGRIVKKLEELGLKDNTVIIFTSDNGLYNGSHGLGDKAILYEDAMRAPLVVFDGRLPKKLRGRRINDLVSSVDHASTILSLAGVIPPESMQGADYSKLMYDDHGKETWRNTVYMENLFLSSIHRATGDKKLDDIAFNQKEIEQGKSYRSRAARTERWKLINYYEQSPVYYQLFDLKNDPYELNDLARNPKYANIVKELDGRIETMYQSVSAHQTPRGNFSSDNLIAPQ